MKNLFYLSMSILISCALMITSSCDKQEMEPDLVPSTTSGENTMGFYLDGIPVKTEGKWSWSFPTGVSGWVNEEGIANVFGSGNNPNYSIDIYFPSDSLNTSNEIVIEESIYRFSEIEYIDDSPLGGNSFQCDSLHYGKLKILRMDEHVLAGTFEFEAVHEESGETIQVTDGRFDIKLD